MNSGLYTLENGPVVLLGVVCLSIPMDGKGGHSIFSSLENCQLHNTGLESLEHLIVVPFHIILVFRALLLFFGP